MGIVLDTTVFVPKMPAWDSPDNPFSDVNDWASYVKASREMMPVRKGGRQVGEGYGFDARAIIRDWWDEIVQWGVPVGRAAGAVTWLLVKNPVVRKYVLNKAFWMAWPTIRFLGERKAYTKAANVADVMIKKFHVSRGELATMQATAGQFIKAGADLRKLQQISPDKMFNLVNKSLEMLRDRFKEEFDEWREEQEAISMAWFTRRRRSYSSGYNGGGYRQYRRGYRSRYNRYSRRGSRLSEFTFR